jgi:hypothetical protein
LFLTFFFFLFRLLFFLQISDVRSISSGKKWPPASKAIVVDGRGRGYSEFSVMLRDGKAAIGYLDDTSIRAYYVEANSENGTTWNSFMATTGLGDYNQEVCAQNNQTRFVYTDSSRGDVYFEQLGGSRFMVHDGNVEFIDSPLGVVCDCQQNIPCVIFHDNLQLYFERAGSSTGDGWNTTHHTVIGTAPDGQVKLLAYGSSAANEALVVIYNQRNNPTAGKYGLNVVVSKDPFGNEWNDPVVLVNNITHDIRGFHAVIMEEFNAEIALLYQGDDNELFFMRTMGGNATMWTLPIKISEDADCWNVGISSHKEEGANPTITLAFMRNIMGRRSIWAGFSDDGGASWGITLAWNESLYFSPNVALITADDHPAIVFTDDTNSDLLFLRALADPPPPPPPPPKVKCPGSSCVCSATECELLGGTIEPGGTLDLPSDKPTRVTGDLGLRGVRVRFAGPQRLGATGTIFLDSETTLDFVLFPASSGGRSLLQSRMTVVTTTAVVLEADQIDGQASVVNVTSEDNCNLITSSSDSYTSMTLSVIVSSTDACGTAQGLSAGAIAGIVVGMVLVFSIIVFILVYVLREREKARKKARFQAKQARMSNMDLNAKGAQFNVSGGNLVEQALGTQYLK